jgi:uncharacterized protein
MAPQAGRWRGVAVFLLLAYGLAWAAQIGLVLALRGVPGGMTALGGGMLVAALVLMWPPAVGAYVARRWVERSGFADAGLRWPSWRYALLAWFGPALLTLLVLLLSLPIYPFDPTFATLEQMAEQTGQRLPAPVGVIVLVQLAVALTLAVPINSLFAFGEEFGWRGYLLPRLVQLIGFWPGVVLHGAIWGFWHAPLILLAGYNYPGHNLLGVPLFVVFGTLAGILFAWLQFASGSVLAPTIAHASINAIAGAPLLVLRGADPAVAGVLWSPLGWIVLLLAIVLVLRRGGLRDR